MKRALFLVVMIGAMNAGSLVCAAQEKQPSAPTEAQVESIREIQARLDQLRAMRKRPELAAQRESIDRGIEELEGDLKAMEGQPGDWSGFTKYDPADDKEIKGPKISARLTAADRQAPGIAPQEDDGSDVRAAFPDIQEQLLAGEQADPEFQQALENSLMQHTKSVSVELADQDEELKEVKSKPQKSGDALAREQEMVRVLSGFKGSAGGDFPGAVAGIAGEYDSRNLWLDPNAQIKFKVIKAEVPGFGIRSTYAAINNDGRWVVAASQDGTTRIWDSQEGAWSDIFAPERGEGAWADIFAPERGARPLEDVAISGNGRWVVVPSEEDGTIRIWDREKHSFAELKDSSMMALPRLRRVAISSDGAWVVGGSYNGSVRMWNRESGQLVHTWPYAGRDSDVAISGDGKWVVTATKEGPQVMIWNGQDGQLVHDLGDEEAIAAISDDGKWVVTGPSTGESHSVRIWDRESGELRREINTGDHVQKVAISPDGAWVVTTGKSVRIWDRQSGKLVHQEWYSHVSSVAISGDGQWIITGSWSGEARIWWAEPADEPSSKLADEPSSNEKLIDIINMRIEVRNKSPEEKTDIKRTLERIKRLIGQGADPAVMVPVGDGGKRMPLWLVVRDIFGVHHEITKYFRSICKEQRDTEEKERIEEHRKRVQQEYSEKVSRGLNGAREYIKGVFSEIEILDDFSPASKRAIESYAERLENLDVSQKDSLEKIEEIKRRVQEEFEEGQ